MDFGHFRGTNTYFSTIVWARRRRRDDDDVATNRGLPGPSPITPRDRIPREEPPHLDFGRSNVQVKNKKISSPNGLSKCPESREMDFGHFRETYFSINFGPLPYIYILA